MTVVAAVFLLLFGGGASWLLAARFPRAAFTRIGYAMMAASGIFALIWSLSGALAFGVAAVVILALGGIVGIVGALRKELRVELP